MQTFVLLKSFRFLLESQEESLDLNETLPASLFATEYLGRQRWRRSHYYNSYNTHLNSIEGSDVSHQELKHFEMLGRTSNIGYRKFDQAPAWPPQSKDNWVEVMVVADGPMVKYHGDKVEQYILTLMKIVI